MNKRTPAVPNIRRKKHAIASHSKALKTKHRQHKKAGGTMSLREFVRTSENEEIQNLGIEWMHNKTANFSKPPAGLGSTRKKKTSHPKKAAPAA